MRADNVALFSANFSIEKESDKRPKYAELLKHPFLEGADKPELKNAVAAWARQGYQQWVARGRNK